MTAAEASSSGVGDAPAPLWTYASKPGESTMYKAVEAVLRRRADWYKTNSSLHFHLLLAERWRVPYARLGRDTTLRQAVNHQRGSKHITVKGLMVKSLRAHFGRSGAHDLIPETFLLVPGEPDEAPERVGLLAAAPAEAWICKPTTGAGGRGIEITRTPEEAIAAVDASAAEEARAASSENEQVSKDGCRLRVVRDKRFVLKPRAPPAWLVQRYVHRPMLIDGRKFDVRAFVLVTHDRRVLWYEDWIARVCSSPFNMSDIGDRVAHITNHCVQVRAEDYGAREEGNELFAADIRAYLEHKLGESAGRDAFERIVAKMRHAARAVVTSAADAMVRDEAFDSFQVLGYDFMADEDGDVWLLEVNGSPAAAERMTPEIAQDIVELAIDPLYPRGDGALPGDALESGRWTDITDEPYQRWRTSDEQELGT